MSALQTKCLLEGDFSDDPQVKTAHSSGNQIPHAATNSLNATTEIQHSKKKKKKRLLGDKDSQCLPDGNNGITSYSYNKVFFYNTHFSYASLMEF